MKDKKRHRDITSTKDYISVFLENIDVFRWVWKEIVPRESKIYALKMFPFLVASTLVSGAIPFLIGLLINALPNEASSGDLRMVAIVLIAYLTSVLLHKFCDYKRSVYREWQLGYNQGAIDDMITKRFFGMSIGQHVRERSNLNVANLEKGRGRLMHIQFLLLFELGAVLFTFITSFILLFFVSFVSGLVILIGLIPYAYISFRMNVSVAIECDPIDERMRRTYRRRVSRWNQTPRVQLADMAEKEVADLREEFDEVIQDDRNFWIRFIKNSTFRELIMAFAAFLAITYSVWQVFQGNISFGMVYPIFAWTSRVTENIWRIGHIERELNYHLPVIKSFRKVMDLEPDITDVPDAVELEDEPVTVEFRGVSHRYAQPVLSDPEGDNPLILRDISFRIEPGEKVALIGASGCGKTTITQLLLRAFDPEEGGIFLNGHDLRKVNLQSWRRLVGHIPQRPAIFDGTLRQNLTYGLAREVPEEEIEEIIRLLRIDFGNRLTLGLDTRVGWDGIELSGGEQQRLIAGAAVIKRPRFVVVDEATASLDSTTEREFQAGFEAIIGSDTSAIVIAHRLSTVRKCDKFFVLRPLEEVPEGESQIEAVGTSFQGLYQQSPTFKRLADDQGLRI